MGERKVLNKYYPPDFDPAKIPKRKQLKNLQMKVRMMLPMSICCNTCGTFMYKGTKFNCRKEDVVGDTYLGLMKFRFYFKCTKCSAELCMKTDPQNSDYEMEFGASRNFEPWRASDEQKDAAKKQREEEEMGDAMKALENRTMDSKMEMDILAGLDEVKSLRARQANVDQDVLLEALKRNAVQEAMAHQKTEAELAEEDEKVIKSIMFRNSQSFFKRIDDDEEEEDELEEEEEDGADRPKGGAREQHSNVKQKIQANSDGGPLLDGKRGNSDMVQNGSGHEGKKQKVSHSEENGAPSSQRAKVETPGNSLAKTGKSPADVLLIKKADEQKPIFEMRPVKVAFAVKEKRKAGESVGVSGHSKKVEGTKIQDGKIGSEGLSLQKSEVRKPVSAPEGLSLLTASYDVSDEDSQ